MARPTVTSSSSSSALSNSNAGWRTDRGRSRMASPPELNPSDRTDGLIWSYCVTRAADVTELPDRGIHDGTCFLVEQEGLAAIASRVPRSEFDAAHIPGN